MSEDKKKKKKPEKEVGKPEKKLTLPIKPDEKSHPDPLKRFKALKEWRKITDKITGEDKIMKWRPEKTFDAAEKEVNKQKKQRKSVEPKRSDYPKGTAGNIKYKVAYRKYLEKIT